MSLLAAADAAKELGVSERRVRQMLADGVLPGERVGRAWVIEPEAVRQLAGRRPKAGRPWKAASAWAVLALAGNDDIDLSPTERSRARRRAGQGLANLIGRLGSRAERRSFYAHPSVHGSLGNDPGVVRSGVSALSEHKVDLIAADLLEAYIPASSLPHLVARFALDDEAERPNVLLRVVDDSVWPFEAHGAVAPLPVVAIDLLESHDERSRRAGAELLRRQ